MPYGDGGRRLEGDAAEIVHQAGEAQQLELVQQLAASGPEGIATLIRAFSESRTSRLRCYILDALRNSDDPRIASIIEAGLSDNSSSTRCHAIEALLLHPGTNACRLLLPLLSDSSAVPRCRAIDAAARLGCNSPPIVAALAAAAGDRDWRIRQAAARAFGALRPEEAEARLRVLAGDPRNAVRVAAEASLRELE